MNKLIVATIFMLISVSQIQAESLGELANDFSKYQKSQQYSKVMTTSKKIVDKFLEKDDFKLAEKFSSQIRNATHPQLSKYGHYLLGVTFHRAYSKFKGDKLLNAAITNYKASAYSKITTALAALALSNLRKQSGLNEADFLNKVKMLGENVESDRLLRASFNHIKYGRQEIVFAYINDNQLDVNTHLSSDGTTLIHMAAYYNKIDVVKELIEIYGADTHVKDHEGDTPLFYAKHKKLTSMVRYLESR